MAEFCLATKVSPTEYKRLTIEEFKAFVEAHGKGIGANAWPQI
jgi:hypothetical protein